MLIFKSIKTQLIVYLACLALFLSIKDRDFMFLFSCLVAVISALSIEALFLYLRTRKFQITESAIISGLIIGFVLSSDEPWWKFVFASALAIISKHLIRIQKKHIFNPAAFGIFLTLVIFNSSTQWKGTYLWYVLVPFGLYFIYKIKKFEVLISYVFVSLALFGTQAVLAKVPVFHIFGYLSYFFIFVMMIEPRTTPVKPLGKYLFGSSVAGLIFVLTEIGAGFDVELFSLLAINASVLLLNKLSPDKGGLL